MQRAFVNEEADRYAEAEIAARRAVELDRVYLPAVMTLVDCLTHFGKDDEAMELLMESHEMTENGGFAGRLQAFYSEREDHQKALMWLDLYDELTPLKDKVGNKWVASRRCDFLYMAGNLKKYIRLSENAHEFQKEVAKRLSVEGVEKKIRKRLDVPFVRQHSMTCAPATLAALSLYFGKNLDHLEIADAICYDGTPWHKERQWAVDSGFAVREFRVTREVVMDLIDRNLPFTLTTSWVTGAHLQACIGYDDRQGTLILRDPTHRHFGEVLLDELIKGHPIEGPRGMLLIPKERENEVDDIVFPDRGIFDALHDLSVAMDSHDRVKMMTALSMMRVIDLDHPMNLFAQCKLAYYDHDAHLEKESAAKMLKLFPADGRCVFKNLTAVQRTESWQVQKELLHGILDKGSCDSVFYTEMGELLLGDVREVSMAQYYLRKAVRSMPRESRRYASLARCELLKHKQEQALLCRRISACLSISFEPYSKSYFDLCVELGRVDEGLVFLRNRLDKQGAKDEGPWITLADALEDLGRDEEARDVLEKALLVRQDDSELMLSVASRLVRWGMRERGKEILEQVHGRVSENSWCRVMAQTARVEGKRKKAMRYWLRVIEIEGDSESAHQAYVSLLADESGEPAAIVHLAQVIEKYPDRYNLMILYAEWLVDDDLEKATKVMERARELEPNMIWCIRELATYRMRAKDFEGAIRDAQLAVDKNPHIAESHGVLGRIYLSQHNFSDAAVCFRQSVKLDIDYEYGMESWVQCGVEMGNVNEVLSEMLDEMRRQVTNGSAVTCYQACAYKYVDPQTALEELLSVRKIRPDLWQAWAALKSQQVSMGEENQALDTVKAMVEKFPLLPRAWMDLAEVCRLIGDQIGEIEALEKALALSPVWDWCMQSLSETYERAGRIKDAERLQRKMIECNPRNPASYGSLADLLWKTDRKGEAFDQLLIGLSRDSGYNWGWRTVSHWATVLDRKEEVVALIQSYEKRNGKRALWWSLVAQVFETLGDLSKSLESVEKGLLCDSSECDLYDGKAYYLANLNRYDDALAATSPTVFGDAIPRELLARRAWIMRMFGHNKQAEALYRKVVKEHPDYVWAQRELMNVRYDAEDWNGIVPSAKALIRLEPSDATAYGWLGQAYENLKKEELALAAFQKASLLDPENAYAVDRVFALSLKLGKYTEMRDWLPSLDHYHSQGLIQTFNARLCCVENKLDKAKEALKVALCAEWTDPSDLSGLRSSFEKSGWLKHYTKVINEVVASGDVRSGHVLADWILGKRFPMALAKKIHLMNYPLVMKENAWDFIMEWFVQDDLVDEAVKLVKKFPSIAESTFLWGKAGWMLVSMNQFKEAEAWLSPLEDREGLEDWMLSNMMLASSSINGAEAARGIPPFALEKTRPSAAMPMLAMAHALMLASDGEEEDAQELINIYEDDAEGTAEGYKLLCQMLLSSADPEKVKALWLRYTLSQRDWKTAPYKFAYAKYVKKILKQRKFKWPGPWILRKPKVKSSSSSWVWLVFGLIIGVKGLIGLISLLASMFD